MIGVERGNKGMYTMRPAMIQPISNVHAGKRHITCVVMINVVCRCHLIMYKPSR